MTEQPLLEDHLAQAMFPSDPDDHDSDDFDDGWLRGIKELRATVGLPRPSQASSTLSSTSSTSSRPRQRRS